MNAWKYTTKCRHFRTSCDPSCTLHQPTRWPPLFLQVREHYHTCVYYGICVFVEKYIDLYDVIMFVLTYSRHRICKVFSLVDVQPMTAPTTFKWKGIDSQNLFECLWTSGFVSAPETLFRLNNIWEWPITMTNLQIPSQPKQHIALDLSICVSSFQLINCNESSW